MCAFRFPRERDLLKINQLLTNGTLAETIPQVEKAAAAIPSNAVLQTLLGHLFIKAEKSKHAIAPFQKALVLDPISFSSNSRFQLANSLAATGDAEECFKALEPLQQSWTAEPNALVLLGKAAAYLEKKDVVERELKMLDIISKEHAQKLRDEIARYQQEKKRVEDALKQ